MAPSPIHKKNTGETWQILPPISVYQFLTYFLSRLEISSQQLVGNK